VCVCVVRPVLGIFDRRVATCYK